jgi:hypothetical protein
MSALRFAARSGSQVTMMRGLLISTIALAAAGALGCAPDNSMSDDAGGAITYTKDIKPIFAVKCAPCHTTEGMGGHNIGSNYADVLSKVQSLDAMGCWDSTMTMPVTRGECALISIANGWMPMAMGCFNTPRPATCVTTDQQMIIAQWVAAGMPQ